MSHISRTTPNFGQAICNLEEVCVHWGKSKNTIHRWIRTGRFPNPFYQAGKPYWLKEDIRKHQSELIQRRDLKAAHKSTGIKS